MKETGTRDGWICEETMGVIYIIGQRDNGQRNQNVPKNKP
jgi:hypothetical protein